MLIALRYKRPGFIRVRVQRYLPRVLRGDGHSVRKVSEKRHETIETLSAYLPIFCVWSLCRVC